ncbi:hypothetical protein CONLIGDRAFT_307920 [Coniochaeta ligniaria NRRL 30616]|uniref:Zinc finger PHD-type domain-containing protein n=1 Tax=Coniochaeta ligniaria NRRL 30616 TaxID=1408157 RepID=A0A1J7IUT0_9PEZI|nr:hypothetical protein CONLIGDRAFT_307920 [Coniochaeta ligniaria NRRL 30616]
MAGADPRRSSRARMTQSQSQHSSTTSSTSGRADRPTRSFHKNGSPQKSTPTGSLSSEPPEDTITADGGFSTRRRTRGSGDDRDKTSSNLDSIEMMPGGDDLQDEDEAVRCICGFDDYPGPPPLDEDSKQGIKDTIDLDPIFTTDVNDDTAGFFVQCDVCKVWQHGACVGIMTEESSPDEYFCEQCRKEFHKIFTASNGQRYSHYLPLKPHHSRTASRAPSLVKDGTKSPKEKDSRSARNSSVTQAGKRRSTMNSREAGYNEAEALRRAIEASKEDAAPETVDGSTRRAKRGRSDSEEKPENAKRQRTGSESVSPPPDKAIEDSDSDEALSSMRNGLSKTKSRTGAPTARSTRSEKPGEKDERERQRVEAANKRKGRAERRRADDVDSDPSEETPLAVRSTAIRTTAVPIPPSEPATNPPSPVEKPKPAPPVAEPAQPPPSSVPSPDTPSAVDPAPPPPPTRNDRKRSHKKKGRNQYTRDDDSPARSQSRDIREDQGTERPGHSRSDSHHTKSRNRGGMSSRITMTDMKRRATALLDFISRTQVELAGETAPSPADSKGDEPKVNGDNSAPSAARIQKKQADGVATPKPEQNGEVSGTKEFRELSCMEMMDSLTRRLVKWQQEYTA